jgi:uncharacterized protein (DUF4415 family)
MKDADIDHSDIPRLDKATMAWPPAKKQLTIRLDKDVLDWLKRHGKGYQTRINRILRVVMESQPPRTAHR